jgi:hypothetical protein
METKPVASPLKINSLLKVRFWLSALLIAFLSLNLHAADPVTSTVITVDSLSKDSMVKDTARTPQKSGFMESLEENPIWKYTAMALGIIVVVAFALFTSMRKNKPVTSANPQAGYRKHHHHHHKPHTKKS